MTDETSASSAGSEAAPVVAPPTLEGDGVSVEEAYSAYQKKFEPAESAEDATAGKESPVDGDAAPAEEQAHGEDEGADPASKEPLIERPKSWTESEEAEWQATPRALQQKIAARELERDVALRRNQNEVAEKLKGLTAKEQQMEQAILQAGVQAKAAEQTLLRDQQRDFPDIKTLDDIRKLADTDPFRYLQWDAHQKELIAAQFVRQQAEGQQAQERQSKRAALEAEQTKLLHEMVPDMADPKKAAEKRERAVAMLNDDLGLKTETLQRWMQDDVGHEILSNAGIQRMIADRLDFKDIKASPPKAIPKPIPAVQRPGVPAPRGNTDAIQASRSKLNSTGSVEDAYALYTAKQKARA